MKALMTSLFFLMVTISGYSQCSQISLSVSSSSPTFVQLYQAGFFLIPNGQDNVVDWTVTDFSGALVHQETTTGPWAEQSFLTFTHTVPITDSMKVSVTITNATSGIVCNINDTLIWGGSIIEWTVLNDNVGALPVELVDFKGSLSYNKISLNWETTTEVNNSGFDIQKSSNTYDWETIEFVKGQGNSLLSNSYQSYDISPRNGINYYRLKQIDFDGQFTYSNILAVEYEEANPKLAVYPNPSRGNLNIEISNTEGQDVDVQIVDLQGRLIWQTNTNSSGQAWNKNIQIESNGVYFITMKTGDEISQEKLIVQR